MWCLQLSQYKYYHKVWKITDLRLSYVNLKPLINKNIKNTTRLKLQGKKHELLVILNLRIIRQIKSESDLDIIIKDLQIAILMTNNTNWSKTCIWHLKDNRYEFNGLNIKVSLTLTHNRSKL